MYGSPGGCNTSFLSACKEAKITLKQRSLNRRRWTQISLCYTDSLRAGLSGDRIPLGGEIFRTRPDRPWGPPSLLYNGYRVFPGGKVARAWRWPPTPISAGVKERVELYLYSTYGHSWGEIYLYFYLYTETSKYVANYIRNILTFWTTMRLKENLGFPSLHLSWRQRHSTNRKQPYVLFNVLIIYRVLRF